jgi:hypothetical protein
MLTAAGVKLLDFGLAKRSGHFSLEPSKQGASFATATGMIYGTVSYMSPEQAEGQPVDARSDLFSFGCVLYAMVTGRQAFPGNSPISILGAILRGEPQPVRELAARASGMRGIDRAVSPQKPEERFQDVEELRQALTQLQPGRLPNRRFLNPVTTGLRRLAWISAVVLMIATAGILFYLRPVTNINAGLPNKNTHLNLLATFDGEGYDPALSPDGKMIVYAAEEQGRIDLFVSRVAGGGRVRVTNDDARESSPCFHRMVSGSPSAGPIASAGRGISISCQPWGQCGSHPQCDRSRGRRTDPASLCSAGGSGNILATAAR